MLSYSSRCVTVTKNGWASWSVESRQQWVRTAQINGPNLQANGKCKSSNECKSRRWCWKPRLACTDGIDRANLVRSKEGLFVTVLHRLLSTEQLDTTGLLSNSRDGQSHWMHRKSEECLDFLKPAAANEWGKWLTSIKRSQYLCGTTAFSDSIGCLLKCKVGLNRSIQNACHTVTDRVAVQIIRFINCDNWPYLFGCYEWGEKLPCVFSIIWYLYCLRHVLCMW